jgi:hypothetical protein
MALMHGVVPRSSPVPAEAGDPIAFLGELADRGSLAGGAPVVLVASTRDPGTGPDVLAVHRVHPRGGSIR